MGPKATLRCSPYADPWSGSIRSEGIIVERGSKKRRLGFRATTWKLACLRLDIPDSMYGTFHVFVFTRFFSCALSLSLSPFRRSFVNFRSLRATIFRSSSRIVSKEWANESNGRKKNFDRQRETTTCFVISNKFSPGSRKSRSATGGSHPTF